MNRKLASIQQIKEINFIPDADKIEVVSVNGWKVVSKKGEFKVNSLCVYFEIDSFLPIDDERFSFLEKSCKTTMGDLKGLRLKTVKLRGQISQGLVLPLNIFPELEGLPIGEDVTSRLNINKYEPPIPAELNGEVIGPIPSYVRKTDEERIQNIPDIIEKHKGKKFNATVKLDGTSCTMYLYNNHFGVCGRNWEYAFSDSQSMWKVAKKYDIESKLRKLNRNIAVQGELIGEGIQGNPEKIKGQDWFIFKIWDIDNGRYLSFDEKQEVLLNMGLHDKQVPILKEFELPSSVDEILNLADGPSLKANEREGIVVEGYGVSFKVISNWYLLKNGG